MDKHSPGELDLEGQTVVEIREGDTVLSAHRLSNDDLVDVIELIPVLVPGEITSTLQLHEITVVTQINKYSSYMK